MGLVSIIVPTYCERENIRPLFEGIKENLEEFELVFVDDSSPDGTGEEVLRIAREDFRVKLRSRDRKLGLGSAFLYGLEIASGDLVVLMDADLSHSPADLPFLIKASSGSDIVVGSRYIPGGRIIGWSWWRRVVSLLANFLARFLLKVEVKDATSGFVLFHRRVLERIKDDLSPRGYKILLEILVKVRGVRVVEVPITFKERFYGRSKLNLREVMEFLKLCWRLRRSQP